MNAPASEPYRNRNTSAIAHPFEPGIGDGRCAHQDDPRGPACGKFAGEHGRATMDMACGHHPLELFEDCPECEADQRAELAEVAYGVLGQGE